MCFGWKEHNPMWRVKNEERNRTQNSVKDAGKSKRTVTTYSNNNILHTHIYNECTQQQQHVELGREEWGLIRCSKVLALQVEGKSILQHYTLISQGS